MYNYTPKSAHATTRRNISVLQRKKQNENQIQVWTVMGHIPESKVDPEPKIRMEHEKTKKSGST